MSDSNNVEEKSKTKKLKRCCVPRCNNSNKMNRSKHFFVFPLDRDRQVQWCWAMRRTAALCKTRIMFACEDHFDLREDLDNYLEYTMVGTRCRLKSTAVPHKFECQKGWKGPVKRASAEDLLRNITGGRRARPRKKKPAAAPPPPKPEEMARSPEMEAESESSQAEPSQEDTPCSPMDEDVKDELIETKDEPLRESPPSPEESSKSPPPTVEPRTLAGLQGYCRLCGVEQRSKGALMISVCGEEGKKRKLLFKLDKYLAINVLQQEAGLPTEVCLGCVSRLEECHDFFEEIARADEMLHGLLDSVSSDLDQPPITEPQCDQKTTTDPLETAEQPPDPLNNDQDPATNTLNAATVFNQFPATEADFLSAPDTQISTTSPQNPPFSLLLPPTSHQLTRINLAEIPSTQYEITFQRPQKEPPEKKQTRGKRPVDILPLLPHPRLSSTHLLPISAESPNLVILPPNFTLNPQSSNTPPSDSPTYWLIQEVQSDTKK